MSSSGSEYEAESTNSDSSGEPEEKPKAKTRRKKTAADEEITNLCGNYTCTACGKGFKSQYTIQSHLRKCERHLEKRTQLTCNWCKLTFTNRGALSIHAFHLHGDTSYRAYTRLATNEYACRICKQAFNTSVKLKFHIRRTHFNLKGRVPYAELKKVNQVWFEKVMNSNNIIEIKKTSDNMLVMKKIEENTLINVNNDNEKVIDVSHIYPTELKRCNIRVKCKFCNNLYVKRDYKKHVDEIHRNKKKHHCNNCNRGFKRFYQFIKHVCNKSKKVKGVKKGNSNIVITSVNSLCAPRAVINID